MDVAKVPLTMVAVAAAAMTAAVIDAATAAAGPGSYLLGRIITG